MQEKIRNKIIAVILLFTLIIVRFVVIGNSIVIAMTENNENETNNKNVNFNVEIKDNQKTSKEKIGNILLEETLLITVEVKDRGILRDAVIKVNNANFEIVKEKINNNYIKMIKDNEIYLNTVTYGNKVILELPIKFLKKEIFEPNYFEKEINFDFEGKYEENTEEKIRATKSIKIKWTTESDMNFTQEIGRYIDLGENGVILEQIVETNIKDNVLPREEEILRIEVPKLEKQIPESVYVLLNGREMSDNEVIYNKDNLTLQIEKKTKPEELPIWGNGKNKYEIIYKYTKEEIQGDKYITLKTNVETKNYTKEKIEENDIKENIKLIQKGQVSEIEANIMGQIYKGYLYENINKDTKYSEINKIRILENQLLDNIRIETGNNKFITEQNTYLNANQNVFYKETKIIKNNMIEILGTEGKITFKDVNNQVIFEINKDTEENEKGEIVVCYPENENKIIIETTKPIQSGELLFENIKTVKNNNNYNKQTIRQIKKLINETIIKTNLNENKTETEIALNETEVKARLELDKNNFSTVAKNNREIKIILKSNGPEYDLYKKPVFLIKLPSDIENIKINNINILYEDELKIKNATTEGNLIKIELEGEQTKYKDSTIEGAVITINADIDLNKKAISKQDNIQLSYKNNSDIKEEIKTIKETVEIVAPKDLILSNDIKQLGIETLGEPGIKTKDIKRGASKKEVEGQIEIINNKKEDLKQVRILGEFPSNSNKNNMGILITGELKLENTPNAQIYYTDNQNATEDLTNIENKWNKNFGEVRKVKKYLILIDQFKENEIIKGTYKMLIPENLEYNQNALTQYKITYANTELSTEKSLSATPVLLQTGIGPNIEVKLSATRGDKEITTQVKTGEIIKYKIEVTNSGTEVANNISLNANIPDGTKRVTENANYDLYLKEYYTELEDKNYKEIIEKIEPKETIVKEYEVRVKEERPEISNQIEFSYNDVKKVSNEINIKTQKGNLEVVVKKSSDKQILLYDNYKVHYETRIKNTSGKILHNIKVNVNLPKGFTAESIYANYINETEEISSDEFEVGKEINIKQLNANEEVLVGVLCKVENKENEEREVGIFSNVIYNNEEYISNVYKDKIYKYDIEINIVSSTNNKYLKPNDMIEYEITIKNKGNANIREIELFDNVPEELKAVSAYLGEEEIAFADNEVTTNLDLSSQEQKKIKIIAQVKDLNPKEEIVSISNFAYIKNSINIIGKTTTINNIIDYKKEENPDETQPDIEDTSKERKIISGIAWEDINRNGKRDTNEPTLSDIKVKIVDIKNNEYAKDEKGKIIEGLTNTNGIYILNNVKPGKYVAIFDYDKSKYGITKYKEEGVSEDLNSNVINNKLNINGKCEEVVSSDVIVVEEENIDSINIGLVKAEKFDMKLDKYINKLTITDNNGTVVKGYNDTKYAKIELDAKKLKNTKITIEYKIKVSNVGELEGYVKNIVDYLPTDLEFDPNINKGWYIKDNNLYNSKLANVKIKPGESLEVKLVLTKNMTEDNTGIVVNIAEIQEDANEYLIQDVNSKPGNRIQGENDLDTAKIIISIGTGGNVYIIVAIIILFIALILAVVLKKQIKKEKDK